MSEIHYLGYQLNWLIALKQSCDRSTDMINKNTTKPAKWAPSGMITIPSCHWQLHVPGKKLY